MGGTNPYIEEQQVELPKRKYTITFLPMDEKVEVDPAELPYTREGLPGSILEIALGHDIEIDHACGGVAACSTCHVIVREGGESANEPSEAEEDMLDNAPGLTPDSRLSCQAVPGRQLRRRGRDPRLEPELRPRGAALAVLSRDGATLPAMRALLANPRGFCAGVHRAIEIVERALEEYGAPVYVLHEIVHNRHVLDRLRAKGVHFVEDLEDIPSGAVTIFSAHGVSEAVESEGRKRGLRVIDATCPLVTKVHQQAQRYAGEARELILIGHIGHPEVEGTTGRYPGEVKVLCTVEEVDALEVQDPKNLAYVTQTTLSMDDTRHVIDALKRRFPDIHGPDLKDICYATQNRQNAVRDLADDIDVLIVVGSANSSNSNRLAELGRREGIHSYLVDGADELEPEWFAGKASVGITAGASAPEVLVQEILERLEELGVRTVEEIPRRARDDRLPHAARALLLPELSGAVGERLRRVVQGENLAVMRALAGGCAALVYVDPPFNTGRRQERARTHAVRDERAGDRTGFAGKRYRTEVLGRSGFADAFDDYLGFLEPRLRPAARRVLAPESGSLFVHLDPRESPLLSR